MGRNYDTIPAGTAGPGYWNTLQDRLVDIDRAIPVSYMSAKFGGVGDNIANDSQAVLDCIDFCLTNGGVPLIDPPVGCFLGDTVDLSAAGYAGLAIVGAGNSPDQRAPFTAPPQALIRGPSDEPAFFADRNNDASWSFRNISFRGGVTGLHIVASAGLSLDNVGFDPDDVASADNAGLILESFFWLFCNDVGFNAATAAKWGLLVRGIDRGWTNVGYLLRFNRCRFNRGGLWYDQEAEQGGPIPEYLSFRECHSENMEKAVIKFTASGHVGAAFKVQLLHVDEFGMSDNPVADVPLIEIDSTKIGWDAWRLAGVRGDNNPVLVKLTNYADLGGTIDRPTAGQFIVDRIVDGAGNPVVIGSHFTRTKQGVSVSGGSDTGTGTDQTDMANPSAGPAIRVAVAGERHARLGFGDGVIYGGPGGATGGWTRRITNDGSDVWKFVNKVEAGGLLLTGHASAFNTFTGVPTITAEAGLGGAGAAATIGANDTDWVGKANLTAGAGDATVGVVIATVNFAAAYDNAPKMVHLTQKGVTAAGCHFTVGTITTTGFQILLKEGTFSATVTVELMYEVVE